MQQTVLPFVPGFLFLASNETRRAIVRSFLLQQSPTRIGMLDFGGKDSRPTLTCPRAIGVPNGIRTRVTAVKGRCPRPLDDGDPVVNAATGAALQSCGGGKRDRTADLLHAMQALSQLSYTPTANVEL